VPGRKVRSAQPASPASDSGKRSVASPAGCASSADIVQQAFRLGDQARRELIELRRTRFQQGEIDREDREASFVRMAEGYGQQARDVLLSSSGIAPTSNSSSQTRLSDSAKRMRRAIRTCLDEIQSFKAVANGAIGPGLPRIAALHLDAATKPLRDARGELALLVRKHGSPGKPYGKALWWGATWTLAHADLDWPRPGSRKSDAEQQGPRAGTAPDYQVAVILHREITRQLGRDDPLPDQRTHAIKASEWAKLKRTPGVYDHPSGSIKAEKDVEN
jgi:hypothetical protein